MISVADFWFNMKGVGRVELLLGRSLYYSSLLQTDDVLSIVVVGVF